MIARTVSDICREDVELEDESDGNGGTVFAVRWRGLEVGVMKSRIDARMHADLLAHNIELLADELKQH